MRALVIDYSRSIRRVICNMMQEMGYETLEAADGLEGLAQLDSHGVMDVFALVDWNMPEMNGIEFIRAVRKRTEYRDMPMVMVTTETEMSNIGQAFMAGVNEYVMKPFDKGMIIEKLQLLGIGV